MVDKVILVVSLSNCSHRAFWAGDDGRTDCLRVRAPEGFATGFLVAPDLLMTNHHVFRTR